MPLQFVSFPHSVKLNCGYCMERQNIHVQKIMLNIEKEDIGISLKVILKLEKSNYSELIVTELKLA